MHNDSHRAEEPQIDRLLKRIRDWVNGDKNNRANAARIAGVTPKVFNKIDHPNWNPGALVLRKIELAMPPEQRHAPDLNDLPKVIEKPRVIIASPHPVEHAERAALYSMYARKAVHDSFQRDEAPFAPHVTYAVHHETDQPPNDLENDLEAGVVWGRVADMLAVYADHGVTGSMGQLIRTAMRLGIRIDTRSVRGYRNG